MLLCYVIKLLCYDCALLTLIHMCNNISYSYYKSIFFFLSVGMSTGQVVGIVFGALVSVVIIIAVIVVVVRRMGQYS